MPLIQTNPGDRVLSSDINQFYNILKGVAASGESITLIYNAASPIIIQPSSDPAAGTRAFDIKNNAGTHLASLDFNGVLELLSAAAAPSGAVTGAVYWDSLLQSLRVYNGTAWQSAGAGSEAQPLPNLVLNSEFGRRTVWGTMMPERFTDLSGPTKIDGGAAGSVAANIFTQGAANNEYAWCAGSFVWRDGRASATFKAVSATGVYRLKWRINATDDVAVIANGTNVWIRKTIASVTTDSTLTAQGLTLNRWYWLEIEKQGTTFIAKMWDTGGTASGVTKASSTLLQTVTFTVADASVQVGAHIEIMSDQANSQWGGIATGDGGVYVEGWLPESWATTFVGGTIGGQAIGIDETADAGPLAKQWALRCYIPATNRYAAIQLDTPDGSVNPSAAYAESFYEKTSGKGGSGPIVSVTATTRTSALAQVDTFGLVSDASEATWTRKTATITGGATVRRARMVVEFNTNLTATGTAYFMLPQLEQGSAATAWRNAPADPGGGTYQVQSALAGTTTSAAMVEVDPRDAAVNVFCPQDCTALIMANVTIRNSAAGNAMFADVSIDGVVADDSVYIIAPVAGYNVQAMVIKRTTLTAGKHRIATNFRTGAGTMTFGDRPSRLIVQLMAGK